MHPAAFLSSSAHAHGISPRIILYKGPFSHRPCNPKASLLNALFSDNILTAVVYSKYQRINIGIQADAIYKYVEQQPVTGIPIQHVMRWTRFDVFRKTHKQFFFIQIYYRFIFQCVCKNSKVTKHLKNFSRCIKTIENIIQLIICKIIYN